MLSVMLGSGAMMSEGAAVGRSSSSSTHARPLCSGGVCNRCSYGSRPTETELILHQIPSIIRFSTSSLLSLLCFKWIRDRDPESPQVLNEVTAASSLRPVSMSKKFLLLSFPSPSSIAAALNRNTKDRKIVAARR